MFRELALAVFPALSLSLKVAIWAMLLAFIVAIVCAVLLRHSRSKIALIIDALLRIPLVLPPTVLGYYLLVVFGRHGVVGKTLHELGIHLVFTWQGAVLAAAVVSFPLIYSATKNALEQVSQKQIQAAQLLGFSRAKVFVRVDLPLASQGIIVGLLLGFARALGEFGATLMLAGSIEGQTQTLSIAIYEAMQAGETQKAAFMVALLTIVALSIMVVVGVLTRQKHVVRPI